LPGERLKQPRVIAHVCEHFRRTTVEAVADAVGVSPGHLARVFTEQMEMTVKEYVTQVKIEAAKALFRETDAKAEAIAEAVGLYDAPHLARVFRRHGCSTPACGCSRVPVSLLRKPWLPIWKLFVAYLIRA